MALVIGTRMPPRRLNSKRPTGMVLVHDRRGELLYACAVKQLAQALAEVADIYELRGAGQITVRRLRPRPWSAIPFTLHPLNLMAGAHA